MNVCDTCRWDLGGKCRWIRREAAADRLGEARARAQQSWMRSQLWNNAIAAAPATDCPEWERAPVCVRRTFTHTGCSVLHRSEATARRCIGATRQGFLVDAVTLREHRDFDNHQTTTRTIGRFTMRRKSSDPLVLCEVLRYPVEVQL